MTSRTTRTGITVVSLLVVLAALAAAQTPAMQTFTSNEGRFSVLFQGTPKQEDQVINLKGGGTTALHQFWTELENNNISYMVMYNDYSADYANGDPQSVLATTRDGAVSGKRLLTDTVITLNGVPGRAFTAEDDNWNYSVRQYLYGKRLYQIIVVWGKDRVPQQLDQFMGSFRIF